MNSFKKRTNIKSFNQLVSNKAKLESYYNINSSPIHKGLHLEYGTKKWYNENIIKHFLKDKSYWGFPKTSSNWNYGGKKSLSTI